MFKFQMGQLMLHTQCQCRQMIVTDQVCFGDDQHICTGQLGTGFSVLFEHRICSAGAEACDHTSQAIALFEQIAAAQGLGHRTGFCQACGFNDQVGKARHAPFKASPEQVFERFGQTWQASAAHTRTGHQCGAFGGATEQLVVQSHFA